MLLHWLRSDCVYIPQCPKLRKLIDSVTEDNCNADNNCDFLYLQQRKKCFDMSQFESDYQLQANTTMFSTHINYAKNAK